jgi:site-specific recombinase XerC
MGNNQSNVLRAQLTQTQRQLRALETKNKQLLSAEAQRKKAAQDRVNATITSTNKQAAVEPTRLTGARFAHTGATLEPPGSIQLTAPTQPEAVPAELAMEAARRQLKIATTQIPRKDRQCIYLLYRGLTQPSNQSAQARRPNFGSQRVNYETQLIFAMRRNDKTRTFVSMDKNDVQWVWQYLSSRQPAGSGTIGMGLRNRTAQQMGRPGVPMPFDESMHLQVTQDPHLLTQLAPQPASDQIQYRTPSSFPASQIHYQQVQNR